MKHLQHTSETFETPETYVRNISFWPFFFRTTQGRAGNGSGQPTVEDGGTAWQRPAAEFKCYQKRMKMIDLLGR
jgi:hypothetical protein